jgi:thiosulfate reductase cytochrome b subunit
MHYANMDNSALPFETSRLLHNVSGIFLVLMYVFFFIQNILSKNYKSYVPVLKGLIKRLVTQTRFYLYGIFVGEPHPYHAQPGNKFNPLQQITYISIMYVLMPVLLLSGLLLLFPEYAPDDFIILGFGGVWPMAILHSVVAYFLTLFMVGHIYLGTTGDTLISNFKSMIDGWHLNADENSHRKE